MTDREKLIELLRKAKDEKDNICGKYFPFHNCEECPANRKNCTNGIIADHLIANGVTFATDTNDGHKWIPVTERLPDLVPCNAGTAYSETVNILTTGRKVLTAIWDGTDFIADAEFWEAEGEEITHWTPVLLPLPKPPKGE